jgi:hypothetical protein
MARLFSRSNDVTMSAERTVQVVNPHGIAWTVRFLSIDAAWSRITSQKGVTDTEQNRKALAAQGWKVEDRA